MTKIDIINAINQALGCGPNEAYQIVDAFFELMKEALAKGEEVKISNFGNWTVREKKSRMGRNPRTGEEKEITARKVVSFKASKGLKEGMNG